MFSTDIEGWVEVSTDIEAGAGLEGRGTGTRLVAIRPACMQLPAQVGLMVYRTADSCQQE